MWFARRRRLALAVVALVILATLVVIGANISSRPRSPVSTRAPRTVPVPTPAPTVTHRPSTTPPTRPMPSTTTSTTAPKPAPPARLLAEGAAGPDVVALQSRLVALGYWLGTEKGIFGPATTHAVVAFEKANGLERDGIVGPAVRAKLPTATRLRPRSTSGRVVEIDLEQQLLLDVSNGRVTWVFDTSTGRMAGSTPTGHWQVFQEVDGWLYGSLGVLYRPKFFHGNVAIHGNPSVPPYPASHGCVRVFNGAMDWLWASGDLPMGAAVWVY